MKKQKPAPAPSVVNAALKSLLIEHQDHVSTLKARLSESKPLASAEDSQDEGGGYNSNGVIAQK